VPRARDDEDQCTADIIALARQYRHHGYRKIAGWLEQTGWVVNAKQIERIWRREGLKVPHKQPNRGPLRLADVSCIRLRPEPRNHAWSYDFADDRTCPTVDVQLRRPTPARQRRSYDGHRHRGIGS